MLEFYVRRPRATLFDSWMFGAACLPCECGIPKTGGAFSLPHAAVFKMKLILMRHTQAEWGFGIEDHERALSAKGLAEAGRLGLWLTENYHSPSHALISDANRTQQTFAALNQTCTAAVLPELYLAPPEGLLLAMQNRETDCLLVLAHNPGIAKLAVEMATQKPTHPRFYDYPPGATLVLDYEVKTTTGRVINFITPDDLLT